MRFRSSTSVLKKRMLKYDNTSSCWLLQIPVLGVSWPPVFAKPFSGLRLFQIFKAPARACGAACVRSRKSGNVVPAQASHSHDVPQVLGCCRCFWSGCRTNFCTVQCSGRGLVCSRACWAPRSPLMPEWASLLGSGVPLDSHLVGHLLCDLA